LLQVDASARATILIWAPDPDLAEALTASLLEADCNVQVLEDDRQLASSARTTRLLVAQAGPRLEAQQAFLRGPIILIDPNRTTSPRLTGRAYAIVANAPEASLMVDRFLMHARVAERAAGYRASPRGCSRCGRGFDALKAQHCGTARRFVRFGSIAICASCVENLRRLMRGASVAIVEGDA
jgi:hypothetical protein